MQTSHALRRDIMDKNRVKLAINTNVLARLFEKGEICVSDFQCLDCPSKQCVMKLCLKTCLGCKNIEK